jgi:hypothetical protein
LNKIEDSGQEQLVTSGDAEMLPELVDCLKDQEVFFRLKDILLERLEALKSSDKESSQSDKQDDKTLETQETISLLIDLLTKDVEALSLDNEQLVKA